MAAKLPLDSPHWDDLTACWSSARALAHLREIVATGRLGAAWDQLRDEILHQGTVYGVTSAVLPHVIEVAGSLPPATLSDFWIDVGFMVAAGADEFPEPIPAPDLREGLAEALRIGEDLALRSFLEVDGTPGPLGYHAVACMALAGHAVGSVIWQCPYPGEGYVVVVCPECGSDAEVDGFGDPLGPPCAPPPADLVDRADVPDPSNPDGAGDRPPVPAWSAVAARVGAAGREGVLGAGWEPWFGVAATVAERGVPARAPKRAVWCLIAAMVAAKGAAPWARTLARLTGHVRCADCGRVWEIADAVGDVSPSHPVDPDTVDAATLVEATGFRRAPAPAPPLSLVDWSETRFAVGPVDAVAPAIRPDGAADIVFATSAGPALLGSPTVAVGPGVSGPVSRLAAVPLPDGRTVLAGVDDAGGLAWWDADTGDRLPRGAASRVLSLGVLRMPSGNHAMAEDRNPWLAGLRDGRVVLVTGDAEGAVRLWDAVSGEPLGELFRRAGQPVLAMAVVETTASSTVDGPHLVAAYGDLSIDVWSSAAVTGERSTMAPQADKLAAVGHERIVAVAGGRLPDARSPVLLADDNGTVSLWETFDVRLGDPLPPDPAHVPVTAVAALVRPDRGLVVATISPQARNLRVWEPATGATALIGLEARPRCLVAVGSRLAIGHDEGVIVLDAVPS